MWSFLCFWPVFVASLLFLFLSGLSSVIFCGYFYWNWLGTEMEKVGDTGDISLLFFLAGANFWAILGNFWAIWAILGHFWAILSHFGSFLGHFLVLIFFGQKFISAIFITFSISGLPGSQSFLLPRSKVTPGADIVGSLWGGRCRIVV